MRSTFSETVKKDKVAEFSHSGDVEAKERGLVAAFMDDSAAAAMPTSASSSQSPQAPQVPAGGADPVKCDPAHQIDKDAITQALKHVSIAHSQWDRSVRQWSTVLIMSAQNQRT